MGLQSFARPLAAVFIVGLAVLCGNAALAEPPPIEVYGELPAVEEMVISPSGERIATLTTVSGKRVIVVLGADLKPISSFKMDEIKVRDLDFISEDHLLLRRSVTEDLGPFFAQDKFEFYQAFVFPIGEGEIDMIFSNRRDLVGATFGYYGTRMVEGRPTGFFGAIELQRNSIETSGYSFNHGRPALYSVDLLTNTAKRVDKSPGENIVRDWLVGAGGKVLARLDSSQASGRWEIRGTSGTVASGENPAGDVYLVAIGRDGDTVIYSARDEATGSTRWYEVKVDGSQGPQEILVDEDIERIYTDPATGQITGYLLGAEAIEPVFFDKRSTDRADRIQRAFPKLNADMVDWTPGLGHVIVRTDGNGDSGTYFKVDLAQSRADPIGSERPAIGPELVGPISTISYTASDGLDMDGILTLPPGREAKGLPLIMLPHGGPHYEDSEGFDWWAQAFASRGYAVFQPNFRGSTNRTEGFIRAGYGQWGRKMQSDISDGLAALAKEGIIDPRRACIVGASYGGYAALAGVTLQQGLYRCAVSVAGVADLGLMTRIEKRESSSKVRERSLEEELGPRSGFREVSPRYQAARADAPILLIHGRDDTVVHYEHSLKMADALKDAGKPYEFVELKCEDHWLSLTETRKAMLKAAMAFVVKHNPPD